MKDSQNQKSPKPNKPDIRLLILVPFCLLIILFTLIFLNFKIGEINGKNSLNVLNFSFNANPYPVLSQEGLNNLSARGIVILDSNSKVVVYSKNPTQYFSPASTTKILTALTAMDKFKLNDVLMVKSEGVEGSTLGLKIGDKLTFADLLYAMMLPSANDAAIAIAQNYPLGEKSFIDEMNKKARSLNLFSTYVEDPVGLEDQKDFTTPLDLAHLASIAMQNQTFSELVGTKNKKIRNLQGTEYHVSNLNILLGVNGVNGVKTGYTELAGQVLVTSRFIEGRTIIIVVMESNDRFGDTQKILNGLSANLTYLPIHP